ncbi:hypothetical protein CH306_11870 [Rhodococcus sp. 15-725-2-2b]|uniref:DUF2752 domain-containing protein n=1 Tax=unclassified Rhodococcus (in: high G+C Gram-positive bacteria) TaxID=192944 RepID=UPI000B9A6FDD|nr:MULTISPECIES: DUF2752 domain-containing protein [unclassified Rhodococcus (in: high G+C Gram-positive bacteria)]OZC68785.1 hypothetical protein CH277_12825 [Rhodococcus sp. 06-469-3-2]OZD47482.1 hypothetical protein CH264_08415 [Rhodococcus sp. 06-1477-1A]OZE11554.1 hypothetical protein CH250_09545 [Rhodococcus sp. 05-2255-3C]OZE16680.1 hypothetical protein CH249_00200 [Rhodococcus sp. 05-2255-3B1]OZE16757.1 hypothetical protein CH255_20000 [Rhodococcus sp. 05-2255-2A2]
MTAPTRGRSIVAPLGVAAAAVGGAVLLHVRDPRTSTYLPCPFHALTGLWCPGCGATRALGDLTRGDIAAAASSNVVAVMCVVVAVGLWGLWLRARWMQIPLTLPGPNRLAAAVMLALLTVFTVVRNTPWGTAIAPT